MQRAYVYIPPSARRLASSTHAVTLLIGAQSCELVVRNARPSVRRARESLDEIGECDDAHTSQTLTLFHLLHGTQRTLAPLLPIERQRDCHRLRAGGADGAERFAHRGAGGDHIVHDQHAALERRADDAAPLAMLLGLLTVESVRHAQA